MIKKILKVNTRQGLHARPAAKLVNLACSFSSEITIVKQGEPPVDCKSIMSVMMLAAGRGCELEFSIDGNDEDLALEAISQLFERRLDEDTFA